MLFMVIAAVSMSVNAHNKLGRTVANNVLKVLGSPLMSLVFLGAALASHVIACACGWGTIGGLVDYYKSQLGSLSLAVAMPGAGLAGWSLFLLLLSLILELSSRTCCKDWKPPAGVQAPGGASTTVMCVPSAFLKRASTPPAALFGMPHPRDSPHPLPPPLPFPLVSQRHVAGADGAHVRCAATAAAAAAPERVRSGGSAPQLRAQ